MGPGTIKIDLERSSKDDTDFEVLYLLKEASYATLNHYTLRNYICMWSPTAALD